MDEQRLAEIEDLIARSRQAYHDGVYAAEIGADTWGEVIDAATALVAEVRRLRDQHEYQQQLDRETRDL